MKFEMYAGYVIDVDFPISPKAASYIESLSIVGAMKEIETDVPDVRVGSDYDLLFHCEHSLNMLRDDWKYNYSYKLAEAQKEAVCTSM